MYLFRYTLWVCQGLISLYEVRSAHDRNIYRVFFCIDGANMVLLHGFMKKTQATPKREVDVARARQGTLRRKS